jgi:PAS domain S-box-containing protein
LRDDKDNIIGTLSSGEDITERKQAEKALRESETRLKWAEHLAHLGNYEFEVPDGEVVWSAETFSIVGRDPSKGEPTLEEYYQITHPDDREFTRQIIEQAIKTKQPFDFEYRIITEENEIKHIHSMGQVVTNKDGTVVKIFGTIQDITERKRTEDALRESEERYRAVFEQAVETIVLVDIETGDIIKFNDKANENLGYTHEEFNKLNITDIDVLEDAEKVKKHIERVKREGHDTFETKHRTKIGEIRDVLVNTKIILYRGKNVIQATWYDITNRKRAESIQSVLYQISEATNSSESLSELFVIIQHQLGKLLDTTNFYIALYDPEIGLYSFPYFKDKHDDPSIIPQSQMNRSLTDYVRRTGAPLLIDSDLRQQLKQSGEVEQVGTPSEVWLGVPLRAANDVIGVVVVQSYNNPSIYTEKDVSLMNFVSDHIATAIERKRSQEQFIKSEKLATLGQLAAGIGHELRNPLGGIKNSAYFLKMALESPEPDLKEALTILEEQIVISNRIIMSLMEFAQQKPPDFFEVTLNNIIQKMLSHAVIPANIEVVTKLDEALPSILADRNQLERVFFNIVLNAIQAMSGGGQLVVETGTYDPEWVAISFTDTGSVIPKEIREKLFEPLFTTKAKGIGLGLALAKNIVQAHGGIILLESGHEKGNTFIIRLPIKVVDDREAHKDQFLDTGNQSLP